MKILLYCLLLLCPLNILANADLVVSTVQPAAASMPPPPDGNITIQVIVQNIGNQTARNFWVTGYANRTSSCTSGLIQEASFQIPSLPAGYEVPIEFTLQARPGDLDLYAVVKADTTNVIIEDNENNNCGRSFQIKVLYPDLYVAATGGPTPSQIVAGGAPTRFETSIRNDNQFGGWSAGSSYRHFYLSTENSNPPLVDRLPDEQYTRALDPGETDDNTIFLQIDESFPMGTYNLFCKADGDQQVIERSETNNFSTRRPLEVVDLCTAADLDGNGTVNILDLLMMLNATNTLVTMENQYLNLVGSPPGFPEVINREDFLASLPCFGTDGPTLGDGGVLNDFNVLPIGANLFQVEMDALGDLVSVQTLVKIPSGSSLSSLTLDPLQTGFTAQLAPAAGEFLLINSFNNFSNTALDVQGVLPLAELTSSLDLSQLETITDPKDFHAGIAVWASFADGTRQVIMKRLPYLDIPDPALRAWLQNYFNLPATELPTLTHANSVRYLTITDPNITDLSGIETFSDLRTLNVDTLALTTLPDFGHLDRLIFISANRCNLTHLGTLPVSLQALALDGNQLASLPQLSHLNNLATLIVSRNQLQSLPELPNSLINLAANLNKIGSLPAIPTSVNTLILHDNRLNAIPPLNDHLFDILDIHDNYLYEVDTLVNLNWPVGGQLLISGNNLDISDCDTLNHLKQHVPVLYFTPQRYMAKLCYRNLKQEEHVGEPIK